MNLLLPILGSVQNVGPKSVRHIKGSLLQFENSQFEPCFKSFNRKIILKIVLIEPHLNMLADIHMYSFDY